MPSLLATLESLLGTRDLYEALGVDQGKDASAAQIKKAYHRSSLKHHPDRVAPKKRDEATKKFQALGAVYKILSDPSSKALYDESGEIDEENDIDVNKDWEQYWRLMFPKISVSDIKNFESQYRFSKEEEEDLKKAYCDGEGDMGYIVDNVLCSTEDDEERFSDIIKQWIKDGTVPKFRAFTLSTSKASKAKRGSQRKKEAEEAEIHAKELGLGSGRDDLAAMIMQRQERREKETDGFLEALAAKYAKPTKKRKNSK